DNLLVRISHIKCAAFEVPFEEPEPADGACGYGDDAPQLLEMLATEGVLVKAGGRYHWMAEAFPAENVSLRSAAIDNFVVIEQGPKPKVIAEVDRPAAPLLIHEEAIYMHGVVLVRAERRRRRRPVARRAAGWTLGHGASPPPSRADLPHVRPARPPGCRADPLALHRPPDALPLREPARRCRHGAPALRHS